MGRYFDEMQSVVERHEGIVEKFIGDAVMAVFGIPVLHEDDAMRAVRAAAEMRERLAALNTELEGDWGVTITVRTGVNTGEVVAGDASGGQRFATGDAVNVAKRFEEAAPPGEILLGEPTYRLVRDAVEVAEVEPLGLKGKSEPVGAYRLLSLRKTSRAARDASTRRWSVASGSSPPWNRRTSVRSGRARATCSRFSALRVSASRGSSRSFSQGSATRPRSCEAAACRTERELRTGRWPRRCADATATIRWRGSQARSRATRQL